MFSFSDTKFLIGSNRKPIFAHRGILAVRCQVFRAMFEEQSKKGTAPDKDIPFVLTDMQPDVFLAMLEFLYTNTVNLNPKIVSSSTLTNIALTPPPLLYINNEFVYTVTLFNINDLKSCLSLL